MSGLTMFVLFHFFRFRSRSQSFAFDVGISASKRNVIYNDFEQRLLRILEFNEKFLRKTNRARCVEPDSGEKCAGEMHEKLNESCVEVSYTIELNH